MDNRDLVGGNPQDLGNCPKIVTQIHAPQKPEVVSIFYNAH